MDELHAAALEDLLYSNGWAILEAELTKRLRDLLRSLEVCTVEDLAAIQAKVEVLRWVLARPEQLKNEVKRNGNRDSGFLSLLS